MPLKVLADHALGTGSANWLPAVGSASLGTVGADVTGLFGAVLTELTCPDAEGAAVEAGAEAANIVAPSKCSSGAEAALLPRPTGLLVQLEGRGLAIT